VERCDVAVIGGGIIGLATARAVLELRPQLRVIVLEKEQGVAAHQSGRNSGVLHSGIYYRPGSLKARLAVAGRASMLRFCADHGVPHEVCGKVIVATDAREETRLAELVARGRQNGVRVEAIDPLRLRELEPFAVARAAAHVPDTGIVDFARVCHVLEALLTGAGAEVRTGWGVSRLDTRPEAIVLESPAGELAARCAVNCAGLFSDRLAGGVGTDTGIRIVPFRGEYHQLERGREHLVRNLLYPVPDPAFPFLGVHLTRGIDGRVHAGPNAVLALAREGYSWSVIDRAELAELLRFPGFRVLVRRYWRVGGAELARSVSRSALARALRRLVPDVRARDLVRADAGVRAQALSADGTLLDDFVIRETKRAVHVVNAPSPGATASLEIGRCVADRVVGHLDRLDGG